jgi:EAL domain-containing protein (putative c-di-GMP-specific phosphodiesterase class I)
MIKIDVQKINVKRLRPLIDAIREHDIELVAEKVETLEQADFLSQLSCNRSQGYYYSQPLSPEALDRYLTASALSPPESNVVTSN